MNILIVSDFRIKIFDKKIYVSDKIYRVLVRYTKSFGKVSVFTRGDYERPTDSTMFEFTDGFDNVHIIRNIIDLYVAKNRKTLRLLVHEADLVVGRLESFPAMLAYNYAKREGKPYYAELMSDPWDGLWNHGFLGKIVAPYAYYKTKQIMWNADYALYVTSNFLQQRYPCKNESIAASNVFINSIKDEVLNRKIEHLQKRDPKKIVLMTTGAVYVKYKGQQYVIEAISKLNKLGFHVRYIIAGEGSQEYLKSVAHKYNVLEQIEFTGKIGLDEVFTNLDSVDIYVQPSLQEGLPRAVIEALSRACPVIGAHTAGIPELISPECVFERKSADAILKTIISINNSEKLIDLAKINFEKSKEFLNDVLNSRREKYFEKIKSAICQQ